MAHTYTYTHPHTHTRTKAGRMDAFPWTPRRSRNLVNQPFLITRLGETIFKRSCSACLTNNHEKFSKPKESDKSRFAVSECKIVFFFLVKKRLKGCAEGWKKIFYWMFYRNRGSGWRGLERSLLRNKELLVCCDTRVPLVEVSFPASSIYQLLTGRGSVRAEWHRCRILYPRLYFLAAWTLSNERRTLFFQDDTSYVVEG